jgi:hypothetical protein
MSRFYPDGKDIGETIVNRTTPNSNHTQKALVETGICYDAALNRA